MEKELRRQLVAVADAYQCSQNALSERTIGHRQLKNEDFIQGVRAGKRGFNIRKYDQLMRWYADNWPDDAVWPVDVPHPHTQHSSHATNPSVAADGLGEGALG